MLRFHRNELKRWLRGSGNTVRYEMRSLKDEWCSCSETHGGGALIVEASAALQLFVHLSPRSVLQDQKHSRVVLEVVVEAQDVGMPGK